METVKFERQSEDRVIGACQIAINPEKNINAVMYNKKIMEALGEMLDIGAAEPKAEIARLYTLNEVFDAVLEYEGIIGYGDRIRRHILEIYGVDLSKVAE